MNKKGIITSQRIRPEKQAFAKKLRKNMTPAEKALWQQLRGKKLNGLRFRRQQIIDGFIVDFYCHEAGLIVEVDGLIHEQQKEADAERQAILESRGLKVRRFTNREVMNNMRMVVQKIKDDLPLAPSWRRGDQVPPLAGEARRGSHE